MKKIMLLIIMINSIYGFSQAPILFGDNLEGEGAKLLYVPGKGAFRAGAVGTFQHANSATYFSDGNTWNLDSIGILSFASGYATKAKGAFSTAMGSRSIAIGSTSTAIGTGSEALGDNSTAIGTDTKAIGVFSTALGYFTTASGSISTAIGYKVSTNEHRGALIIGDSDPKGEGITYGGLADEFVARFANGYFFMTSGNNHGTRTGMVAGPGANAWSGISDMHRKENFQALNDKLVLNKLASVEFTSWNYKGQEPETYRHYGIMAQDFYELFGQDNFGTIGNDTLVNPLDMMGIAMSAIKGAKLEIEELKDENEALKNTNTKLEGRILAIEKLLAIKNQSEY